MKNPPLNGNSVRFAAGVPYPSMNADEKRDKSQAYYAPQKVGSSSSLNGPRGVGNESWKWAETTPTRPKNIRATLWRIITEIDELKGAF